MKINLILKRLHFKLLRKLITKGKLINYENNNWWIKAT